MKIFLTALTFITAAFLGLASHADDAGFAIEEESELAVPQPGPHQGGGATTAFPFFSGVPDLEIVFRKRILHPGAAIGYHEQHKDEIYYVASGTGELTMNGEKSQVGPGTSILTRQGNSHGLRQTGSEDLVIFIVYRKDG
ncbi:cupin domain-containing protein [Microbulbifer pacificus]|uniref:Cupin domain-containing protein n=1 Tax=Microbulbifer pacificus TaxID=407164 RepID=A0AAU0MV66_9GAMM|nr:cupin domain-containing protein [Microbulbifer pacificus]WOX04404.1 cupin domain-containing protein [Microbulbifer pacificus]